MEEIVIIKKVYVPEVNPKIDPQSIIEIIERIHMNRHIIPEDWTD